MGGGTSAVALATISVAPPPPAHAVADPCFLPNPSPPLLSPIVRSYLQYDPNVVFEKYTVHGGEVITDKK